MSATRPGERREERERSPLQAVEQAVLARATELAIDPTDEAARAVLGRLVDEEVARWGTERRAAGSVDLADPDAVAERALRNLTGYGPLEPLLADPDVWEIMINSPWDIFVKRHGGPSGYHHEVFHDDDHVVRTLSRILDRARGSHRRLDPAEGLQDAQLDDGARLHIVHGELSRGGHVLVNIRKFTGVALTRLEELVERGTLTAEVATFLRACVVGGASVVFAGPPGAGKTTLLSCCAAELDPALRVVVAEEVFEVDVPLPNVAGMQTRGPRPDRPPVDLRRLVAGFLRMAPDVAIVGEVRDHEALPLLLTLSSGVAGLTTIHAGSSRRALSRLRFVCQLSEVGQELSTAALTTLVSEAVDVVVHSQRGPGGPEVTSVLAVEDLATDPSTGQFITTEVFRRTGAGLAWTGQVPVRLERALTLRGLDVRSLLPTGAA